MLKYSTCVFAARKRSLGQGNMFIGVCVSVHRGRGAWSREVPGPGGVCLLRGMVGGAWSWGQPAPGGMPGPRGGACSQGGACSWRVWSQGGAWWRSPQEVPGGDPPKKATAAGGMHPTGMHSCFLIELYPCLFLMIEYH